MLAILMPAATYAVGEKTFNELEARVTALENQAAIQGAMCYCDKYDSASQQIDSMEKRIGILEKTVNFLVGNVSSALTQILKFLVK